MRNIFIALCLLNAAVAAPAWAGSNAGADAPSAVTTTKPYTVDDTPIGDLLDDPAAAAIIDKYIPGFSKNPETELARGMTLRMVQPYAADAFTDEVLEKMDADFEALAKRK